MWYNFLKPGEGGPEGGVKGMLARLRFEGIDAVRTYSPLIGHVAVEVFGPQQVQKHARHIIFG
jgi:hypothetical protein